MNAGRLNERITIQSRGTSRNAIGEPVETWATFAEVWANVRPVKTDDRFGGVDGASVDATFTIRVLVGLQPDMRIVWKSKPWEIVGEPLPSIRRDGTVEIMARRGVRDGRE